MELLATANNTMAVKIKSKGENMKTKLLAAVAFAAMTLAPGGISERVAEPAYADQDSFCLGFEEGYKSIAGSMVIVPICPIAPITPIGSTAFREGIKAGIRAACQQYPNQCR